MVILSFHHCLAVRITTKKEPLNPDSLRVLLCDVINGYITVVSVLDRKRIRMNKKMKRRKRKIRFKGGTADPYLPQSDYRSVHY